MAEESTVDLDEHADRVAGVVEQSRRVKAAALLRDLYGRVRRR